MRLHQAVAFVVCFSFSVSNAQEEIYNSQFRAQSSSQRDSWHENANWSSRFGAFVPTARVLNEAAFVNRGEAVVERLAPEILNLTINDAVVIEPNGILPVRGDIQVTGSGTLRVAGLLTADTLTSDGTLRLDVIPGETHGLQIASSATLGGVVEVYGPTSLALGEGIELFSAAELTDTGTEVKLVDARDPALNYRLTMQDGTISVVPTAVPHAIVSRATGRVILQHTAGDVPVTITGYTLRSESEQLLPDSWRPIGQSVSGFIQANPTATAISELSLNEPFQFEVGARLDLGVATTTAIASPEDISFRYSNANGEVQTSNVAYVGVPNDIVLHVDPVSGNASMRFLSTTAAQPEITEYQIASTGEDLRPELWTSPTDLSEWQRSSETTASITESLSNGTLPFEVDSTYSLGAIFPTELTSIDQRGITFSVTSADGSTRNAPVVFTDPLAQTIPFDCNRDTLLDVFDANCTSAGELADFLSAASLLPADTNGDQIVDFADFLVLSQNFGEEGTFTEGDFDRSGRIEFADFLILSQTFGSTAAASVARGEPVAVPEPSSWILLLGLFALMHRGLTNRPGRQKAILLVVLLTAITFNPNHASADEFLFRFLDIEPDDSSTQITSIEYARELLAGPVDGAVVVNDLEGFISFLDVGGNSGTFPGLNRYPAFAQSDFVYRATATIDIPAGDWTLAFQSDDGGYVSMPGIQFLETYGEDGPTIIEGDGEIIFSRPRAQRWTGGTFTVPEGGTTVSLDSAFYERAGQDVFEVAITPGHVLNSPSSNLLDWAILADGAHGWDILPREDRFDFSGNGTVDFADFLVLATHFEQPGGYRQGDANSDFYVDLADFALFRNAYLESTQQIAAVPEPATGPQLWVLLVGLMLCLRKNSASRRFRSSTLSPSSQVQMGILVTAAMLGCFAEPSHAQTESRWLEASNGSWSSASNWSTSEPPSQIAIIEVADGEPYTVLARDFVNLQSLRLLSPDATLSVSEWFTVQDIEMNGSTIRIRTPDDPGGRLEVRQQITGTGLIQAEPYSLIDATSTDEVTFGEGIVFETAGGDSRIEGGLINEGTVRVNSDDALTIQFGDFINRGTIDVGGYLDISVFDSESNSRRLLQNEGSFVLRSGSTFNIYGMNVARGGLGTIVNEGAEIARIHGFLENVGTAIDLGTDFDGIGNLTFFGIRGGRIVGEEGDPPLTSVIHSEQFDIGEGGLHGVTLAGEFAFDTGKLYVDENLTLDDARLRIAETASLEFRVTETQQRLDGTGEIILIDNPDVGILGGGIGLGGSSLVIGPDITIRTDADTPPASVRLEASRIEGTIRIDSDTRFEIPGEWTNTGEIIISAGEFILGTLDPERLGSIQLGDQAIVTANVNHNNVGKTIVQDQSTGAWTFSGSISGGTFIADAVAPLLTSGRFDNLTLDGVQYTGGAVVQGQVQMVNGALNLTDTLTMQNGSSLLLDQPITGNGTIRFAPEGFAQIEVQATELTLPEGLDIHVSGTNHEIRLLNGDFTTAGQILLDANSSFEIAGRAFQAESDVVIEEGAILNVRTTRFVNAGNITLNESLLLSNGPTFQEGATFENTGTGVIEGDGVIRSTSADLVNNGTIGPGNLLIQANILHQPDATLRFELGGTTDDAYDSLLITAALELAGGGIELSLVDGFVPSIDDEFTIVYANSITGQFAEESIVLGEIPFDIIYGLDTISLRSSPNGALVVPEPASLAMPFFVMALFVATSRNGRLAVGIQQL